jgi:hypothetical protein
MQRALLFAAALGTALVVLASPVAWAQPARRVIVQPFSGPQSGGARAALIRDLEENGVVVVPDDQVRAARERLGLGRRLDEEQYVALARELDVSAYVEGRVVRRRRAWSLSLRVRNGADGREVGSETWGGTTAASLGGVRRNGFARLSRYFEQTRSPAAPAAPPEAETPWYARGGPVEEPEVVEEPPARPPSTRYDALRIEVVGGTLFRWLDTTVQVYASQRQMAPLDPTSTFLDEARRYQSGGIGHFELGGRLELYPGAFGEQPFPYLGLVVAFTHSIGVVSNGVDRSTGDTLPVPTNQLDLFVGARGRYRFGADRREPEVHLEAGWGLFHFDLGLDALQRLEPDTVIPPMQHGYVQLGGGLRYGIVPTYFTVGVDFAYRIGTHVGGDTRNVWGIDTGPSNGLIAGLELKTEIPEVAQGFYLALRVQYFHFVTAFRGQVGCARAEECAGYMDPWSDTRLWEVWPVAPPPPGTRPPENAPVVGGPTSDVTDNYVRAQLAVGFAFN